MIDVMGGHTNAAFATIPTAVPQVKAGKVRALAVGARQTANGATGRSDRG